MSEPPTQTWNECYSNCVAILRPGSVARATVLLSGWLLMLAGFVIANHLHLEPAARAGMSIAWLGGSARRLYGQARGFRAVRQLIVSAGGPDIAVAGRATGPCRLLPGSFVLRKACWFRLRLPGGQLHTELVLAAESSARDWRRLQTLWRWGRRSHE